MEANETQYGMIEHVILTLILTRPVFTFGRFGGTDGPSNLGRVIVVGRLVMTVHC